MNTNDLWTKHFENTAAVGIFHPNFEAFFDELNKDCLEEDKIKGQTKERMNGIEEQS